METIVTASYILFTLLLLYFFWRRKRSALSSAKSIPGPRFLESIRVFFKGSIRHTLHKDIQKWVPKYGPLMGVNLGFDTVVFFNDCNMFQRFVKDPYYCHLTNDRPRFYIGKYIFENDSDIFLPDFCPEQKERRRILHSTLKVYGEGVGEMETLLTTTLKQCTDDLETNKNIEISRVLRRYILTVLRILLSGNTMDHVHSNLDALENFSEAVNHGFMFENETPLQKFPFLRYIPGLRFKKIYDDLTSAKNVLHDMYLYPMKETYVPGKRRGIIDDLLALQEQYESEISLTAITGSVVKNIIQDIVLAGYQTTSSTLTFLLLNVINNENIQERLYKDISEVVGDENPKMGHRKHLPYVEAVILETLRIQCLEPLLQPHIVREDIVFDGFYFPKGVTYLMNMWHCHHREDLWDDPWKFQPERFLTEDGELLDPKHPLREEMIPFGKGKRSCPGETFAKFRLFMTLTTLINIFRFYPPDPPAQLPSADPRDFKGTLALSPEEFMCKVERRSKQN